VTVHREIARKHVPCEAYLACDNTDTLILPALHASRTTSDEERRSGPAIAAEVRMSNAGQERISEGFRLGKSERAVPGGAGVKGSVALPHPLF